MKENAATVDKNAPEQLLNRINSGRHTLLLILIMTVVNLLLLLLNSDTYFLFSASIPYYLTLFGMVFDEMLGSIHPIGLLTIIALVISAVILGLYLLCWILGKKRRGWLIAALIFFSVDTVGLIVLSLLVEDYSGIVDLVIHVFAVISIASGVRAYSKLKTCPINDPAAQLSVDQASAPASLPFDQNPDETPRNGLEF